MSIIFEPQETDLAVYGVGYALPIAALAYFMKVRSYISKGSSEEEQSKTIGEVTSVNSESNWLTKKD